MKKLITSFLMVSFLLCLASTGFACYGIGCGSGGSVVSSDLAGSTYVNGPGIGQLQGIAEIDAQTLTNTGSTNVMTGGQIQGQSTAGMFGAAIVGGEIQGAALATQTPTGTTALSGVNSSGMITTSGNANGALNITGTALSQATSYGCPFFHFGLK